MRKPQNLFLSFVIGLSGALLTAAIVLVIQAEAQRKQFEALQEEAENVARSVRSRAILQREILADQDRRIQEASAARSETSVETTFVPHAVTETKQIPVEETKPKKKTKTTKTS